MKTIISAVIFFLPALLFGQNEVVRTSHFNLDGAVALDGYDPVSYFQKSPAEGDKNNSYTFKGVTYYFSSATNLALFKAAPEKYEPAFGGWCAYAMGETGEKVKVDPETYKIVDGRLFLFYNFWGNNTLKEWNKDEAAFKEAANRNWRQLLK
jgi:YHS domain-containing protein